MEEGPTTNRNRSYYVRAQEWWRSTIIRFIHRPILCLLQALSSQAARYPWLCVSLTIIASIGLLAIGWQTNFVFEAREQYLWTPIHGMASRDGAWLDNTSMEKYYYYYNQQPQDEHLPRRLQDVNPNPEDVSIEKAVVEDWLTITVLLHQYGNNVVTKAGMDRLFEIHETAITTEGYQPFCQQHGGSPKCPNPTLCQVYQYYNLSTTGQTCQRIGPTAFFLNNADIYRSRVRSNEDVQTALSPSTYANWTLDDDFQELLQGYNIQHLIGHPQFRDDVLVKGQSYTMIFVIPNIHQGWEIAVRLEERLLQLRQEWLGHQHNITTIAGVYALELTSAHAFEKEVERGLFRDIPFVGLAFVLVAIFTMTAFCRLDDPVRSRSALGFGAIACVCLSIMAGYGLLFCFGVPFTAIAQLLPFVMFGIGVDDAFILMVAYDRTDPREKPPLRIRATIQEVGVSVSMTSVTSVLAFCLGSLSSIPAVRWLCLYAFPMVAIDLLFQCTFFVALIVIDERRVQARRRDCLCCTIVPDSNGSGEEVVSERQNDDLPETNVQGVESSHTGNLVPPNDNSQSFVQRIMIAYTDWLLMPGSQAIVLVLFTVLFALCAYSTSLLTVAFDFTSVLPKGSFVTSFYRSMHTFAQDASIAPFVHFRFQDQSNPEIQEHMDAYVMDLYEQVDGISSKPSSFWLWDYRAFLRERRNNTNYMAEPFNETFQLFLKEPEYRQYWNDVVLDANGDILYSRVKIFLDNVDLTNVDEYLGAFRAIREVGRAQSVNQDEGAWSFFVFETSFYLWEFLDTTAKELTHTVIVGVAAVAVTTVLFMPHFLAALYVVPMIVVTFVDLCGFLQVCGVSINGVSFIALVMSIGLLVDYIMHVALRYFESAEVGRRNKAKDMLLSMGSSVLLGGISTFLGTMSLAFTSTAVFFTIFVSFCGIVTIGIPHGLVLFPVVLSLVGPQ